MKIITVVTHSHQNSSNMAMTTFGLGVYKVFFYSFACLEIDDGDGYLTPIELKSLEAKEQ